MSWVSKHLGIKLDSHTLGNLVKNLSPVAGTVIGGPLGLLAAEGLSAAGDLGRGKNIWESLRGGLTNVSLAAGGQALGSHFGYHGGLGSTFGGGSPAAPTGAAPATSSVPAAVPPTTGALPSDAELLASRPPVTGGLANAVTPTAPITSAANAATTAPSRSLLSRAGSFIEAHPTATSMGLNAVSNLATSGAQNRTANAQAKLLEKQADETEYDFMQRKAREAALAPLWGSLGTALGEGLTHVPPNPYAPARA